MSAPAILFFGFVAFSMAVTLVDWRRGWLLAVLCGTLQDPVRKLTPGHPVEFNFSILAIFFAIVVTAHVTMQRGARDIAKRFPNITAAYALLVFMLVLAAINGLFTFGLAAWKAPAISLFIYCVPVVAVLVGYIWPRREEDIVLFFVFYAVVTSIALIGTPMEYFGARSAALGLVGIPEGFIRHLPGVQIKLLSGFYRAPDIMGWHAATLTAISLAMALRAAVLRKAWPWIACAAWGFLNCMLSGRRKAVYYIAVFAIAFMWRYFRRLRFAEVIALVLTIVMIGAIVRELSSNEQSNVYARGAVTSRDEIKQRLEGGVFETIRQHGLMGAGLGTATQGVRHLLGTTTDVGWQEGGLGKLAVELGVPGILSVALLGWVLARMLLRATAINDLPGTSQIVRVMLFALLVANVVNFIVSAQAYSDAVLALLASFFLGCFFATTTLDERVEAPVTVAAAVPARATA